MKDQFRQALNQIEADEALVSKTEARLRTALAPGLPPRQNSITRRIYEMRKYAIAACIALLLIGGGFAYATPVSYLGVDINPSVELGINALGRVVEVIDYNDDGKAVLEGLDLENMKVDKAVKLIVDTAVDLGFLEEDTDVQLTAVNDDEEDADKLLKKAKKGTDEALEENDVEAEVGQAAISLARRDAAREYSEEEGIHLSPGKLNLIQKLWEAQNPDEELTADNYDEVLDLAQDEMDNSDMTYAEAPVKEIMKAIKAIRMEEKFGTDSEEEATDETAVTHGNSANAPGQQLKNQTATDDDDQVLLPNGKVKKNGKSADEE